jgi:preprotein translocase subunit YajC
MGLTIFLALVFSLVIIIMVLDYFKRQEYYRKQQTELLKQIKDGTENNKS